MDAARFRQEVTMDRVVETPIDPPTASAVARRGLILAAVACRGHIETGPRDAAAEALQPRIIEWLNATSLMETLEPEEHAILIAPLGALSERQRLDAGWRIEGAAILAWALGKYPLPPHDAKIDPFRVAEALGFLWDEALGFVRFAQLRDRAQLNAYRGLVYAIHCRLREVERRPKRDDLEQWIQPAWLRALGLARNSPLVEGDLAIEGEPLHRVEPAAVRTLEEVVRERHRAAIWLVGEAPGYWELTVDM
jgi:hypothetical protein